MKEKKEITLGTVVATSIGAIFWIIVSCFYFEILANTTALILMICFAISWSIDAIFKLVKFLKQRKRAK